MIANSLAHLFHARPPGEKYQPLNTIETVRRHPLAANFDASNEWSFDHTGDGIWSHPNLVGLPTISPLNCRIPMVWVLLIGEVALVIVGREEG